jgi:hypothetical protein
MKPALDDQLADPFHELTPCPHRTRVDVLGSRFDIESNSKALLRLVDIACSDLPVHALAKHPPRFRMRLFLSPATNVEFEDEPPHMQLHAGNGMLCGIMDASNFAVLAPREKTAMLVVSRRMLDFPYHLRYELIEFALYTLAARAQRLISLHAGCIGRDGRGLLLIGASGGGKSTLSLHALLHGLELIAEDGILASPTTLRATGIGSYLHLREDCLGFVDERIATRIRKSPVIRRRSGVEKFEIDLRRTHYPLAPLPLKIVATVILSKQQAAGGENLLRPLGKQELARRLVESQPYAAGQLDWPEFSQRVLRAGGYELLRGKHPDEGVVALEGLL